MPKILLSIFSLFLSLAVGQAQNVDSAALCCDNLDVMRIEFNFDRAGILIVRKMEYFCK